MGNGGRLFWQFARTILLAVGLAFIVTSVVEPTIVSGNSMYPTIESRSYMLMSTAPYLAGEPEYSDIIVFNSHIYMENGQEKDFIKRVIGLPGDSISISGGYVYLNGERLAEEYINDGGTQGTMEQITVKADHVFVLGDNRNGSRDSRDPSIGQIATEDIIGKAMLRLYPFDQVGTI